MGEAIGVVLVPAAGVALSPFPVIAVILMLFTARPRLNGALFAAGFAAGLLALGAAVWAVVHASGADEPGDASDASYWLRIAAGLALLVAGVRKIRRMRARPEGQEPELPRWMASIDRVGPGKALATGALLGGLNPKNVVFTAAAVAAVAQAGLDRADEWVALVVYVVLASSTCILAVAYRFAAGDRAAARLDTWRTWLAANNELVMAVLFLVFAGLLIGQGVSGL